MYNNQRRILRIGAYCSECAFLGEEGIGSSMIIPNLFEFSCHGVVLTDSSSFGSSAIFIIML